MGTIGIAQWLFANARKTGNGRYRILGLFTPIDSPCSGTSNVNTNAYVGSDAPCPPAPSNVANAFANGCLRALRIRKLSGRDLERCSIVIHLTG